MNDILQAVKDVFATFAALGWLPIPLAIATVTMLALRVAFEPAPIAVYTKEDMATAGRMKMYIFAGVTAITLLIQYGSQKPANGFDRALCIGFALGDAMFAYVITSSNKVKGLIKDQFMKGATDATPPAPPAV